MEIKDKVIIVTGAANGIGEALCRRFVQEKAEAVIMTDIEGDRLKGVADELGALAITVDVRKESDIIHAVQETEKRFGRVDLFCSNAGVGDADGPGWTAASSPNDIWQRQWEIPDVLKRSMRGVRSSRPIRRWRSSTCCWRTTATIRHQTVIPGCRRRHINPRFLKLGTLINSNNR